MARRPMGSLATGWEAYNVSDWFLLAVQSGRGAFVWSTLGVIAAIGALAILSPRRFSALSNRGSQWVDTNQVLAHLDKRIEVDQYVLPHARLLGAAVIASVGLLAWLFVRYF